MEGYYEEGSWAAVAAEIASLRNTLKDMIGPRLEQPRISCIYCYGKHTYDTLYEEDCRAALKAEMASLKSTLQDMICSRLQQPRISCIYCCGEHTYDYCPSNPNSIGYVGNMYNQYSNNHYEEDGWTEMKSEEPMLQQHRISCIYCCGEHLFENCPSNPDSMFYVGNWSNAYSSTHDNEWMQQPSYSWLNQGAMLQQNEPTDSSYCQQEQPWERQDAMMQKQDALMQSHTVTLRNIENHLGQIANALNNQPQGFLPSDTYLQIEEEEAKQEERLRGPESEIESNAAAHLQQTKEERPPSPSLQELQDKHFDVQEGCNKDYIIDVMQLTTKGGDNVDEVVAEIDGVVIGQQLMLKFCQVKECRGIDNGKSNVDKEKTIRWHNLRLLQDEWKTRKFCPLQGLKVKHRWKQKLIH